ncbi:hypothetical protein [Derxia gummosa]|uniref:Uncharacterized protein n=1 Tax=Derxia gummosa DSM 723 TaxID=1121388 RepID=A0A8B6X1M2_9BURK|nr:hypothetical protein [Derxia gummosa]
MTTATAQDWASLSKLLKSFGPDHPQAQAGLDEFRATPDYAAMVALWEAHADGQALPADACASVLRSSGSARIVFGIAHGLAANRIRMRSSLRSEAEKCAEFGLDHARLKRDINDFLSAEPAWAARLDAATYGSEKSRAMIASRERFLGFQDRAIDSGRLEFPDPWTGAPCHATDCFHLFGRAVYLFLGTKPFYLVTGGAGHKAVGLLLPALRLFLDFEAGLGAITKDEALATSFGAQLFRLARHADAFLALLARTPAQLAEPRRIALRVGRAENFAHWHWNFLTGVERQVLRGPTPRVESVITGGSEFFAPFERIYPEYAHCHVESDAGQTDPCPFAPDRLMVATGGYFIPASLRARLIECARRLPVARETAVQPEQLPVDAWPVIWFGMRTGSRAWIGQAEGIARVIAAVGAEFPQAVFLLDGFSYPVGKDLITHKWAGALEALDAVAHQVIDGCPSGLRARVFNLLGNSLRESVLLAAQVDFYLAPIGTTQHKVGWFCRGTGLTYSGPDIEKTPPDERPGTWEAEDIRPAEFVIGRIADAGERRNEYDIRNNVQNVELDVDDIVRRFLRSLRDMQATRAR